MPKRNALIKQQKIKTKNYKNNFWRRCNILKINNEMRNTWVSIYSRLNSIENISIHKLIQNNSKTIIRITTTRLVRKYKNNSFCCLNQRMNGNRNEYNPHTSNNYTQWNIKIHILRVFCLAIQLREKCVREFLYWEITLLIWVFRKTSAFYYMLNISKSKQYD